MCTEHQGNSYNDEERCVAAGYDNGDLKLFDLRTMSLHWETHLPNGVCDTNPHVSLTLQLCSVQFDRKDINMNKLLVTSLESKLYVYDMRTQHPKDGYALLTESVCLSTHIDTCFSLFTPGP